MSTRAVIRFSDPTTEQDAIVCRDRHGEPEQVVTNLAELERLGESVGTDQSPGVVAAQFVFIDKLYYLLLHRDREDIKEEILQLLVQGEAVQEEAAFYLGNHSIGLPGDEVEEQFLYYVTIQEGNWRLKVGRKEDMLEEGVFDEGELEFWGRIECRRD